VGCYEVRIRTYGAISTTFRKKLGWIDQPPVKEPPREWSAESSAQPDSLQAPQVALGASMPLCGDRQVHSRPPICAPAQDEDDDFLRARKRGWATMIAKVYLENPQVCRTCGEPMRIIAAISSPEQDDVIEKILRSLGRWDPPWQRQRTPRARAPPRPTSFHDTPPPPPPSEPEFIELTIDDEQHIVDPPAGDDW